MPKLWSETIEEHRRAVHDATLDTTAALVREHGLAAVTLDGKIYVIAGGPKQGFAQTAVVEVWR